MSINKLGGMIINPRTWGRKASGSKGGSKWHSGYVNLFGLEKKVKTRYGRYRAIVGVGRRQKGVRDGYMQERGMDCSRECKYSGVINIKVDSNYKPSSSLEAHEATSGARKRGAACSTSLVTGRQKGAVMSIVAGGRCRRDIGLLMTNIHGLKR